MLSHLLIASRVFPKIETPIETTLNLANSLIDVTTLKKLLVCEHWLYLILLIVWTTEVTFKTFSKQCKNTCFECNEMRKPHASVFFVLSSCHLFRKSSSRSLPNTNELQFWICIGLLPSGKINRVFSAVNCQQFVFRRLFICLNSGR